MAPTTTELQPIERDVLDHFKEGVGALTIGLRVTLDVSQVREIIQDTCGGDRQKAAALVAAYDRSHGTAPTDRPEPYSVAAAAAPAHAAITPRPAPPARPRKTTAPAAKKTPRATAQPAQDEPAAPTVVPVDLTETAPADVPVTEIAGGRAADLFPDHVPAELGADLAGEPALVDSEGHTWHLDDPESLVPHYRAAEGHQGPALPLATVAGMVGPMTVPVDDQPALTLDDCTHGADCKLHPRAGKLHNYDDGDTFPPAIYAGVPAALPEDTAEAATDQGDDGDQDDAAGDAWADLDRAMSPVLAAAAADMTAQQAIAEAEALAGPTEPLPEVRSFEDLMAAVQAAGDAGMSALATEIGARVDQLHARYADARKAREIRAEAVTLRRDLSDRLAALARLEDTTGTD